MKRIKIILSALLAMIAFAVNAQKLPATQQISLWAPANIKIDGKTTEWNDVFQAYNPVNRMFYTMSNDVDNLYLAIRINDEYGIEKAVYGTVFTIKLSNRSKENIAVTYPTVTEVRQTELFRSFAGGVRQMRKDTTNAGRKRKKIDSLSLVANKRIGTTFKEIQVTGIKEIQEPLISIYNIEEGIKVAAQFNNQMQYVYELAIPLKYLGPNINGGEKFNYNIRMKGVAEASPAGMAPPIIQGDVVAFMGIDNAYVMYPTDFSGEYTLAKK